MRTDFVTEEAIQNGNLPVEEEVEMGISADALPHIAYAFSNIYNDPETAIIREYIANAMDATRENGGAIEVIAPTEDSPVFVVRDWGKGMDKETLKNVCGTYFGSTKNTSSDEIGGWGIGFMSALAVTNQFMVSTTKDGVTVKAQVTKSDYGMPKMKIISTKDTPDKSNGTSISVSVDFVSRFIEKMYKFAFFQTVHDIQYTNLSNVNTFKNYDNLMYQMVTEVDNVGQNGSDVKILDPRGPIPFSGFYILMGGIYYEVPVSDILSNVDEKYHDAVNYMNEFLVVIEAPIDSVTLSPNREGVQFVEKTREFFRDLIGGIYDNLVTDAIKSITDASTYKDAYKAFNSSKGLSKIVQDPDDIKWEGYPLFSNQLSSQSGYTLNKNENYILKCNKTYGVESDKYIHISSLMGIQENYSWKTGSHDYVDAPTDIFILKDGTSSGAIHSAVKSYFEYYVSNNACFIVYRGEDELTEDTVILRNDSYHAVKKEYTVSDISKISGIPVDDLVIQYQDILDSNREYRKKNGVKAPRVPAREKRLNSSILCSVLKDDGLWLTKTKKISEIVDITNAYVIVDKENKYSLHALEDCFEHYEGFSNLNEAVVIYDNKSISKSARDAYKKEFPNIIELDPESIVKSAIKSNQITKSDVEAYIRLNIVEIFGISYLLRDSTSSEKEVASFSDPLMKKIVQNYDADKSYQRELRKKISFSVGFKVKSRWSDAINKLQLAYSTDSLVQYLDDCPIKGYDGLKDRLMSAECARYTNLRYASNENLLDHFVEYLNADYRIYLKGKKKA